MAIFRPTCRVRLQLSLDEGAEHLAPAPEPPKTWLKAASGSAASVSAAMDKNYASRQSLCQLSGTMAAPDFAKAKAVLDQERYQLEVMGAGGTQQYPSSVDPNQGERGRSVIFNAVPENATIVRAPTKDADTAQVTFDFKMFPIDPRCVRAALVIIDLGAQDADSYVAGMLHGAQHFDGTSMALIGHDDRQELRVYSTTRFIGFVSHWKVSYDESGDTVQLDCVDVSCVMRTQQLREKRIDFAKPVDEGVQDLIDSFVTSNGIKVILGTPLDPSDLTKVQKPDGKFIPADVMPKELQPVRGTGRRGAKGKKPAKPPTVTGNGEITATQKSEKQTVWDHINDVVLRLGLVPVMRGFTLYLLEPRLLFKNLANAKQMVVGKNVKRLEMTRKMEGITTDTIEIRCADRSIGRVRWARYPVLNGEPKSGILGMPGSPQPVFSRASGLTPNGVAHEHIRVMTVPGVAELATLEKIAESTFHEIGRQEIQGQFSTDEIDSWGSKTDADLLDLWPGDPVALLISSQSPKPETDGSTTFQALQSLSKEARQKYLESLQISPENSKRLAEAQEKAWMTSTFRASYITIRWSAEEGVAIEGDYYNFIVLREDPNGQIEVRGARPTKLSEALNQVLK